MIENIPLELRALPQWACAGPDKVPISPRTGEAASTTDPATWGTFEEAVRRGMAHVGFMLAEWDPYTIIDLDNKAEDPCTAEEWATHQTILETFDSYTERSASGRGYHIIVRGKIPRGVKRGKVEAYSAHRFMICTGDVVRNTPIADHQILLDQLFAEMARNTTVLVEHESTIDDQEIVEMAMRASNADKFNALCNGEWGALDYPSQSEADFALLSILAFYTRDNEQVRRLFRMSKLGKRDKAQRDSYLNRALSKIRASEPPLVDISALQAQAVETTPPVEVIRAPVPSSYTGDAIDGVTFPPGLVGEVADYIYRTAIRPVPEIALAASLALTSGIVGRSYNISGSGLNQYIILLARTGTGKEGATTGIDNLLAAIRPTVPMVDQFIGPSAFASGQALIKTLDEKPCFVSILGEFGLTLQQLCDPRANPAQIMLKKVLLDLYAKSGWNKILRSSVYSDATKNTRLIQAPNVTILGESTPETFFEGLDASHIAEGLIPRFSIIEYTGPRSRRNRNANAPPSAQLVQRLVEITTIALTTMNNNTCGVVQTDASALKLLDAFDIKADDAINSVGNEVEAQLWNRAHLKALKLSALIAVGVDPHAPIITSEIAQWAIGIVETDTQRISTRFTRGEIGTGAHRHESDIRKAIEAFLTMIPEQRAQYKTPKSILFEPVVPFHYLRRRLRLRAAFKNDRRGPVKALEESIKDLIQAEILVEIPSTQAIQSYGVRSPLYAKGPLW